MSSSDDGKKPAVGSSTDRPKKRINKPLIEKRRRERINECLNQLQTMITQLDKDKSKRTRSSKLEKADILEMTVEFIKNGRVTTKYEKSENVEKIDNSRQYIEGYKKCVEEINTFFKNSDNVSQELKTSILGHVSKTLNTEADSSTSTKPVDEKHLPQSQPNNTNCANIKPKLLPAGGVLPTNGSNPIQPSTSGLVIQPAVRQTVPPPSGNQYAMVYNREIPTYVLVPTATLCHSLQVNVGAQGLPNNNTVPVVPTVVNNTETCGSFIQTVNNDTTTNCNQIVVLPSNPPLSQPSNCFLGTIPNPPTSNSFTGSVPPLMTFRDVNPHLEMLNRPVIGNSVGQPQEQQADADNVVWRPW